MGRDLYASNAMKVYRVYDPQENKFCCTGRSLYSGNGRSAWFNKGGAVNARNNMPDEIKDRLEIKVFQLVEIR
jgi:hypothetical protein